MKTIHLLIIILTLVSTFYPVFGQSVGTPGYTNDLHWYLDASRSDEFITLDNTKWNVRNNFDHYGNNWTARTSNVSISSQNLKLDFKRETYFCPNPLNLYTCYEQSLTGLPYNYTTGYVESKFYISYGYIEARIKLPKIIGMNAAFWLINRFGEPYGEIDIFEALYGTDASWMGSTPGFPNGPYQGSVHNEYITTSNIHPDSGVPQAYQGDYFFLLGIDDYSEWHTYGIEYTSQKIIWFIDGIKVREEINPLIDGPLHVIFNIGGEVTENMTNGQVKSMEIEYFHYYPLKESCQTLIASQYNFDTHNNEVRQSITIGTSGTSNQVNTGSVVNLRAKESILINGEFTVPIGAEFTMYPNDCE